MGRQIIGVILIVIAAIVGIHTVVEPLYFDSSLTGSGYNEPVWAIINVLSAIGCIMGVVLSFLRKRALDAEGGITWDRLAASALFYGFAFAAIIFFWSWFNLLSPNFTAIGGDASNVMWILYDALFTILAASMGVRIFKGTGG